MFNAVKCMERNPGLTIPRYNDVVTPVPWYIVISGFHCICKKLKVSSNQLNPRNDGLVLLLRMNAQKFRTKVGHSQKTNLPSFLLYREI